MDGYRERLKSFIQGRYSILFHDIDSFINILYRRPLKAVVVNKRLIDDPIVLEQYLDDEKLIRVPWSPYVFYSGSLNFSGNMLYHLGLYYIMDLANTVYPLLLPTMKYKLVVDLAASPGERLS